MLTQPKVKLKFYSSVFLFIVTEVEDSINRKYFYCCTSFQTTSGALSAPPNCPKKGISRAHHGFLTTALPSGI
ncbi:hypothetical protein CHARACLAT_002983 [Characodon lateralis]|uniref:Uncharacterized protein n=1 Tax=Characodon lateralis TaxID=208331 RepID=A0ABU7EQG0_9TELE|nr:hypothetical protein [Characodon lateralis]